MAFTASGTDICLFLAFTDVPEDIKSIFVFHAIRIYLLIIIIIIIATVVFLASSIDSYRSLGINSINSG